MNIGNMVVRILLRKLIGMGVNKGIGAAMGATRKRKAAPQVEEAEPRAGSRPTVKRNRQKRKDAREL